MLALACHALEEKAIESQEYRRAIEQILAVCSLEMPSEGLTPVFMQQADQALGPRRTEAEQQIRQMFKSKIIVFDIRDAIREHPDTERRIMLEILKDELEYDLDEECPFDDNTSGAGQSPSMYMTQLDQWIGDHLSLVQDHQSLFRRFAVRTAQHGIAFGTEDGEPGSACV